jgi:CHAT domain-containing protein
VLDATRAVQGDSAGAAKARWEARLGRDSSDQAATLGLATIERLTYDYPASERLYARLYKAAAARPDAYAVYGLLGRAQGLEARGIMLDIDGVLSRARAEARALQDRVAEGQALFWLAIVRAPTNIGMGVALSDSALRVLPENVPELRAECRCRRAHLLVVLGRADAAAELKDAVEFARRVGDAGAQARCLRAVGVDLNFREQADSSLAVYRKLEELRRRMRDRSGLAQALTYRANVLRNLGSYGEAREVLYQALTEAGASHNLYAVASAKLLLGQILLAVNDHTGGAEHVDQALASYTALADSNMLMVTRHWRGVASLAAGDLARARRETREALEFTRRQGDVFNEAGGYETLANIAMRAGDWTAAEGALNQARLLLRRLGRSEQQFLERGWLALHRGQLAVAERALTRHLGGLDSAARLPRYEARTYLADIHARRGDLRQAERELTVASDEIEAWRATLSDQELRVTVFQASAAAENDRNASVARVLAALAAGGRTEVAFQLAERRRARELKDQLVRGEALRAGASAPVAAALGGNMEYVTAEEVAAQLPEHTALLEFVAGAAGVPTTLFVVQHTGVRAQLLPSGDSLAERIGRFVAVLEAGGQQKPMERALGAAVMDPAIALLDSSVTRLVIVPDGPLHQLPLDVLRLPDGHYVVERYAISTAPSASVVLALWRRSQGRRPDARTELRLLALGDPKFADEHEATGAPAEAAGTYRSAFDASGGLPRLTASANEVRLVARYAHSAEVRLRERASAAYLKQATLTPFSIIHLATHALVDERSASRTALALAPGEGESGFLGPGDLAALALDAYLVVLSACRTAGGVVVQGEGVQGLTAPLLQAGARSVIATGWRIDDRSTVRFIDDIYSALARRLPLSEALRAAKLAAIARGAPPSEWAAFTAVGDPLVTVPLRRPSSIGKWWASVVFAFVALVAAAYVRSRSRSVSGSSSP